MQMEPEEEDAASIVRAEGLCSPEPAAFAALRDETREIWPGGAHMVSGAQQGLLLHTLVRLSRAARVLEVGCFTGYATLWMALGLAEGGTLLSLERDDRCAAVAQRHLDLSGVGDRVELRVGDALHSLEALADDEGPFDLVFLDADKKRCTQYYELLMARGLLHPHSLVLVDNVLWKGHVLDRLDAPPMSDAVAASLDGPTRRSTALRDALHGFSMHAAADSRVRQLMLPLRDGLTWVQPAAAWEHEGQGEEAQGEQGQRGGGEAAGGEAAGGEAAGGEAGGGEAGGEAADSTGAPAAGVAVASGIASGDAVAAVGNDPRLRAYLNLVGSAAPAKISASREALTEEDGGQSDLDDCGEGGGALRGRLLHTLVRLSRAARVLEVGCFTGCATLWMALGLAEGGTLLSLERDDRCAAVAQRHLDLSGVGDRVELRVGDALHSLEALADHAAVRQGKEPGTEGDAAGPFDVVVWHCGRSQTDCEDAPRKLLDSVLGCVSPNGVLVLSQPPPSQQAGAGDVICGAVASDPALCVVTLPSPDGDGAMLSLISRSVV